MKSSEQAVARTGVRRRDYRAIEVARTLRDLIDAECVILFGSRCRDDWRDRSDVDLMVINPGLPTPEDFYRIKEEARAIAKKIYSRDFISVDLVFMTSEEYERKSLRTINNVAVYAREEGIKMTRDSDGCDDLPEDDALRDPTHENGERNRRIADANMHYNSMQVLLDAGMEYNNTVYHAHQALEHGLKALISAMDQRFPHIHNLTHLVTHVDTPDLDLRSNLSQLANYAGGDRYGPALNPVTDFTRMANDVTHDLDIIHECIARLTAEDPWAVPPEGTTDTVRPRRR